MSVTRERASRVFTISFPADLAAEVEKVAKQESRNISELFREAFRTYRVESMQRRLAATRASVTMRSKATPREDEVEHLVDEVRAKSPGPRRKA